MRSFLLTLALMTAVFSAQALAAEAPKPAAAAAQTAPTMVETGWKTRCAEQKDAKAPKQCEIFQRLQVKESNMLVVEMAVGMPADQKTPRGVIILPLGVLLEKGIVMKVDDGRPVPLKVQYCTNGGCFAYVDLGDEVLDDMKKGTNVHFLFKAIGGQNVDLSTKLSGFGKALKEIM